MAGEPEPALVEEAVPEPSGLMQLAEEKKAGLFATFGGQGYAYMAETRELWASSAPEDPCRALITDAAAALLEELQLDSRVSEMMSDGGLDLIAWLEDESATPPDAHLFSAAVSYPLVGTIQMAHVAQVHSIDCPQH